MQTETKRDGEGRRQTKRKADRQTDVGVCRTVWSLSEQSIVMVIIAESPAPCRQLRSPAGTGLPVRRLFVRPLESFVRLLE